MPRTGATIYDLLLSCPSDVTDLKNIVKECVEDFNRLFGNINNIKIELKHWSTDSYPQSGGKPQELLNNQFIHECDACVALFANKFGTPTDKYESGTEEEIEDMINSGKQVFLYFIERPVNPTNIDTDQLAKVRNFKEKYTNMGIYWLVKSNEEFKKLFTNHLTLYFLKLISEPINSGQSGVAPKLEFLMRDRTDELKIEYSNFHNSRILSNKDSNILEQIDKIKAIKFNKSVECEKTDEEDSKVVANSQLIRQLTALSKSGNAFKNFERSKKAEYQLVEIDDDKKSVISKYCYRKSIEIDDDFWCLGNLKREIITTIIEYYVEENLQGTEEEKRKYDLLEELYLEIYEYQELFKFFSKVDEIPRLNCIISNVGTTFDEDIDIKIIIPQSCILKVNELPIPRLSCIEEINEKDLMNAMFCYKKTDSIDTYSDYAFQSYRQYDEFTNMPQFGPESSTQKYEREKKKYISKLEDIFCYDYYDKGKNDVLVFNIKYLKQNTSMYLPSVLLFNRIPEYIEYEIRSKYSPEIIRGRLEPHE